MALDCCAFPPASARRKVTTKLLLELKNPAAHRQVREDPPFRQRANGRVLGATIHRIQGLPNAAYTVGLRSLISLRTDVQDATCDRANASQTGETVNRQCQIQPAPCTDHGTGAVSSEMMRSLAHVEQEHIQRVLAACAGNISQAARVLGLHRRSLQRKLAKIHTGYLKV